MKRFRLFWCAAVLFPFLAACNVNVIPPTDYNETRTFDLTSPAPLGELPFFVEVETFTNECSGRYKMIVREDANRISVDEYNRWAMTPGAMLTKYLASRFAAQSGNSRDQDGKPVFVLDGSVLNCELNKAKKQVVLQVHFFIIEPGSGNSFRITGTENCAVPVDDSTAEAFADGLNKAAGIFSDRVAALLKDELQKRAAEANAVPEKK